MSRTLAVLAGALYLAGCATPLGPGFRIEHQELHAEYVAGVQAAMRVRAAWIVKNTGNQPLDGVDASLPNVQTHDLRDVRVGLDEDSLAPASAARRGVRFAFDPPLPRGETRHIALSYELRGAKRESAGTDVTELGFILPPGDWAPVLLRPKRAFSKGGEPPNKWEMTVQVPASWRVHASGKLKGVERRKEEQPGSAVYRFEQRRKGFLPFAVGGAYHEEKAEADGREVIFWTREALPAGVAQRAAEAAAGAAQFYDSTFGARPEAIHKFWIIECPRKGECWAVPETALVGGAIRNDRSWSAFLVELEQQLAYTWLDFQVHPDWDREPLPMGALADYATELATAARVGGDARNRIIHGLVADFDYKKAREPEPPVFSVQLSDPESARQFAGLKSELFLFALEDAAGQDNLHRALRHLLSVYHGGIWRADDLRSALEQESGKNLAPLFRAWLVEPGLPGDFRERY
jgi:hypothetical protein